MLARTTLAEVILAVIAMACAATRTGHTRWWIFFSSIGFTLTSILTFVARDVVF